MKVKKKATGLAALKAPRESRLSVRIHSDVKRALEFLAAEEQRTLSSYLDRLFVAHLRDTLDNHIESDGSFSGQPEIRPSLRRR